MAAEEAVDAALLWACKCCGCASIRRPGALLCASCWPGEGSDVCEQTLHLRRLDYARQHGAPPSGLVALHVQQPLEQVMRDELRLSLMDQMISNTVGARFHRTCSATYDLPPRSSSSSTDNYLASRSQARLHGTPSTPATPPHRRTLPDRVRAAMVSRRRPCGSTYRAVQEADNISRKWKLLATRIDQYARFWSVVFCAHVPNVLSMPLHLARRLLCTCAFVAALAPHWLVTRHV
jgi:hypothetical protein